MPSVTPHHVGMSLLGSRPRRGPLRWVALAALLLSILPASGASAGEPLACGSDLSDRLAFRSEFSPTIAVGTSGELIRSTIEVLPGAGGSLGSARTTIVGHGPSSFSVDVAVNRMEAAADGSLWLVSGRAAPSGAAPVSALYRRSASGSLRQVAVPVLLPTLIGVDDANRALVGGFGTTAVWVNPDLSTTPAEALPSTVSPTSVSRGLTYQSFVEDDRRWIFQGGVLTDVTALAPFSMVGEEIVQMRDTSVTIRTPHAIVRRFDIVGVDDLEVVGDLGWLAERRVDAGSEFVFLDRQSGAMTALGTADPMNVFGRGLLDSLWYLTAINETEWIVNRLLGPAEAPSLPEATELEDQVARLYEAYLSRPPDAAGLRFWTDQRAAGASIESISQAFATAPEFTDRYGALDDGAFVDVVYRNVLGREPDAVGRSHWVAQLGEGLSRGSMMVGFSDSAELVASTSTTGPSSSRDSQIHRLYRAYFLRSADAGGQCFWSRQLAGVLTLEQISESFAASPEFRSRYGALDDEAFVRLVFDNVLGRAPDAEGLAFWVGELSAGRSRGSMMIGFSESPEFRRLTGTLP